MAEERDVRFVTEESFDFGFLSPSDSSREEEEDDEESLAGAGARGGSGRWSPLSGARLEEMVREATRLAAQLERCHLPLPAPPGPRSPRSPRRETFVVKDSPVRALLPTVEPRETPPGTTRSPAKPRGPPAATNIPGTRKVSSSCHPTAAPKGPPGARVPPPNRGSLRRGGAQPPSPLPPASPVPGPLLSPSPPVAPPHPAPSLRHPAGPWRGGQHQVGGHLHPEVQAWHGRPPRLLVRGANQDPSPAASAPPGRRW